MYNLKIAFRNLRRNGVYSVLNIAGLAVGIAAAALIFLWANYNLSYNRNFSNAENIYRIAQHQQYGDQIYTFYVAQGPLSKTLNETFPEIKRNARIGEVSQTNFKRENSDQFVSGYGGYIDSTIFSMIRMEFVRGNPATAFEPAFPIVISRTMAERSFGNEDPIGQTLWLDKSYEVTGVFIDLPKNCSFPFDWMIPFRVYENDLVEKDFIDPESWQSNWYSMYVEIAPHTDVNAINQKLKPLASERTNGKSAAELFIYPITKLMLYEFKDGQEVSGYIRTVRLFFYIGALILLIACINFMNLSTARSQKRTLEVGVRKTFGAKRSTLIKQFIGESGLITAIALIIAVGLVIICLPSFNRWVSMNLQFDYTNWVNWAGLLGIGIVCAFLAGSYPAFYLSSFSPMTIFQKMKIRTAGSAVWIRKGLVIFQFAAAFILICATLVIYLQIRHAQNRDIGFNKENLVSYKISDNIKKNYAAVQNELVSSGVAESAGMCNHFLFQIWSNGGGHNWQGKNPENNPLISYTYITPGLIETAGLKLNEGRDFVPGDEEKNHIIINQSMADLMGEAGHVGGQIWYGNDVEYYSEIIGIIDDFVFNDLFQVKSEPLMIDCYAMSCDFLYVRLKPNNNTQESLAQISNILQKFSPNDIFNASFMDDSFRRLFNSQYTEQKLSLLFAALAIFISCLGLFGLSAFSAEQRTKEIGIRKTLGAGVWNLVNLLIRNFLLLIGISFVIGIPVAWYVTHRWLSDYQYRIQESWILFAAVGILIIIIALLTVGVQSLRAATANPVKAIQTE